MEILESSPNAETREVLDQADRGENVTRHASVDTMFSSLGIHEEVWLERCGSHSELFG